MKLLKDDLSSLRQRLEHVSNSWSVDHYNSLITFYIQLIPRLMKVDRCTIFLKDPLMESLVSMYGTGLENNVLKVPLEGSIVGRVLLAKQSIVVNNLDGKSGHHLLTDEQTGFLSRNTLCTPIKSVTDSSVLGVIQLLNTQETDSFTEDSQNELEEIAGYLSISIESILLNTKIISIAHAFDDEVSRLECDVLRDGHFIAESSAMRKVLDLVQVLRDTPVNVLIQGENGTGKELVARMIHNSGGKENRPFVPVNCACLPEALVESEFFGHEKGAFTGAVKSRKGRFEEAKGGSLFLDEIGEMTPMVQPKFLRAIQEQEGSRLGSNVIIPYDVRLISATNCDLSQKVAQGDFREDLFFRLFSVELEIPPLRDRKEDIVPLALSFLKETNLKFSKNVRGFEPRLLVLFEEYQWPGNVRQLLKEVERLVALTKNDMQMQIKTCSRELQGFAGENIERLSVETVDSYALPEQVKNLEKSLIQKAMKKTAGNKTQAAGLLHITRQGLLKKIKRYQIARSLEGC